MLKNLKSRFDGFMFAWVLNRAVSRVSKKLGVDKKLTLEELFSQEVAKYNTLPFEEDLYNPEIDCMIDFGSYALSDELLWRLVKRLGKEEVCCILETSVDELEEVLQELRNEA